MLAEQVPAACPCQKAKGPVIIESEDEVSEAPLKVAQGKAKAGGRVHMVSPRQGVSSIDGGKEEAFASGKCLWLP